MADPNALIAASQEVTRANNAVHWGRWLPAEMQVEAEERLQRALDGVVRAAIDIMEAVTAPSP